jgi:hypothetical protein
MEKSGFIYKLLYARWNPRKLGLNRMSIAGLALASMRWALQDRITVLLHPDAQGAPPWARLLLAAELIFFLCSTLLAVDNVVYAVSTRKWSNLNIAGIVLCLALGTEVGWSGGGISARHPISTLAARHIRDEYGGKATRSSRRHSQEEVKSAEKKDEVGRPCAHNRRKLPYSSHGFEQGRRGPIDHCQTNS